MSKFDFDKEISRKNTSSLKWDVSEEELPMWVADMDFATAPCVSEALIKRASHPIYGYSIVPSSFYEAYVDWWRRRHGFTMQPEWIHFCTGVVPAISSIVKRVTNVGDNVAVMTPAYDIFFHSIENFGRHVLECPLFYDGKYSIDFHSLEKVLSDPLTTLLILCNPHNPTGNVWTASELKKVGALCDKYGVTVISDEIHCDIVQGKKYTPFALATGGNGITCISASKVFNIAGLQAAAVVVPDPVLRNKVVRGLNSDEVAEPNCFAVVASEAALRHGEQWLIELNAYIAENKQIAASEIDKIDGLRAVESHASYLVWIDCSRLGIHSDELGGLIRSKSGLFLSTGSKYRGNGEFFLRMNVACPKSRLYDGLNRLKRSIEEIRR